MKNLIDSRTLFLASALVSGAFAPLMYLTMRTRKTYPGYGRWTASMALFFLTFLLMGLRGLIPDIASVLAGNILAIIALLLISEGIRMFCGWRTRVPWAYAGFAALLAAQMYYLLVHNSLRQRMLISSVLLLAVRIYMAMPLLRAAPRGRRFGYLFTASVFLFTIPIAIYRLVTQLLSPVVADLTANSLPNVIYYSSVLLFIIGIGFSYFLLTNERLVAELSDAHQRLQDDAEERLRLQERLGRVERLEAVGRLAGGVAHFFNNQMCIVQLHCEQLLLANAVSEPSRQLVERVAAAGSRSSEVTARLLQFARANPLRNSHFDLSHWLTSISADLRIKLGELVELRMESADEDTGVFTDSQQLSGVLMNMAANARLAMPAGGQWTLRAEVIPLESSGLGKELGLTSGRYVCLSAIDTGCGMDEEMLKHIFEPFHSRNLAEADGLSLAAAFGMMQQCGGTMTATSTVGAGSTFCLYFPSVRA